MIPVNVPYIREWFIRKKNAALVFFTTNTISMVYDILDFLDDIYSLIFAPTDSKLGRNQVLRMN